METVNHIDETDLNMLHGINRMLFDDRALPGEQRRDLANAMHALLAKVQSFPAPQDHSALVKAVQDALGTAEEGEALVEVAANAHKAERQIAAQQWEGWTNYETWATFQHIHNEEMILMWVRHMVNDAESEYEAAKALEDGIPEKFDLPVSGLAADYANAAMGRVEWREIANYFRNN